MNGSNGGSTRSTTVQSCSLVLSSLLRFELRCAPTIPVQQCEKRRTWLAQFLRLRDIIRALPLPIHRSPLLCPPPLQTHALYLPPADPPSMPHAAQLHRETTSQNCSPRTSCAVRYHPSPVYGSPTFATVHPPMPCSSTLRGTGDVQESKVFTTPEGRYRNMVGLVSLYK